MYWDKPRIDFSSIKGRTIISIEGTEEGSEEITIHTSDYGIYKMYHSQDCCETVTVEDVVGDINDIIGSPILLAEEVTEEGDNDYGTHTWTFYKLSTIKGSVTIRWYGESNGYYSEEVSFVEHRKPNLVPNWKI